MDNMGTAFINCQLLLINSQALTKSKFISFTNVFDALLILIS